MKNGFAIARRRYAYYSELAAGLGYTGFKRFLITLDIFRSRIWLKSLGQEYVALRFDQKRWNYRKGYLLIYDNYVSWGRVNMVWMTRKVKNSEGKRQFNHLLGDMLGRDWLDIDQSNLQGLKKFVAEKEKVIFKPVGGSLGQGIFTYEPGKDSRSIEEIYDYCRKEQNYLCEDYLVQHPDLAALHPQSVNTVRILGMNDGENITFLAAELRIGTGDNLVDNLHHGGIGAAIDLASGVVTTPGQDSKGRQYAIHPDTFVPIVGLPIPHWEKVLDTVRRASPLISDCVVIGWDIAITPDGVAIMEANRHPGLQIQLLHDKPCGEPFRAYCKKHKKELHPINKTSKEKFEYFD